MAQKLANTILYVAPNTLIPKPKGSTSSTSLLYHFHCSLALFHIALFIVTKKLIAHCACTCSLDMVANFDNVLCIVTLITYMILILTLIGSDHHTIQSSRPNGIAKSGPGQARAQPILTCQFMCMPFFYTKDVSRSLFDYFGHSKWWRVGLSSCAFRWVHWIAMVVHHPPPT